MKTFKLKFVKIPVTHIKISESDKDTQYQSFSIHKTKVSFNKPPLAFVIGV
jgi:hypothetical protein